MCHEAPVSQLAHLEQAMQNVGSEKSSGNMSLLLVIASAVTTTQMSPPT